MEIKHNCKKKIIQNLSSKKSFEILSKKADVCLIDVRTQPEWQFVGVPDLSLIKKKTFFVSWQIYPLMIENKNFEKKILDMGIKKNNEIHLICRSGQRSYKAASYLLSFGFTKCFNVVDGFEGKLNPLNMRGLIDGWKYNKLPWKN